MFTASQVLYGLRNTRNKANSVVIAAYRKDPAFAGDVTWEMVLAVTPFDGRPCQVLWDENTVRYHIVPHQCKDGERTWGIDCYDGAQYWDRPPVFLVGLGISKLSEEAIWNVVKDTPIEFRDSAQEMYKDWVWDLLPVSLLAGYPTNNPNGIRPGLG